MFFIGILIVFCWSISIISISIGNIDIDVITIPECYKILSHFAV